MSPTPVRLAIAGFAFASGAVLAQAPPGYYDSVDLSSVAAMRSSLHDVIDDHTRLPYTASSLDTWDVVESAWRDPADPNRVVDVYRNDSFRRVQDRVSGYNREHVWPKSYGFPNDDPANYPYTDCHALFLSDAGYNTARSNLPFDDCGGACAEYPTLRVNGHGGGSGAYPGNSNWGTGGAGAFGSWEAWIHRRGDVARAILYLDVRYEGDVHGGTGVREPDLVATDDRSRIAASQTGSNERIAYMGVRSTLLLWHAADPVDADEMRRNDVVFGAQGNRNPFVDHPEWVGLLFGGQVGGSFNTFGTGCAGSNGSTPAMAHSGDPRVGRTTTVVCGGALPLQPAVLNFDTARRSVDLAPLGLSGCTALALPGLAVSSLTNGFGTAASAFAIPHDLRLVGQSLFAQWVVLDPAGRGAALSDGAELRIGRP